ncbi:hypothetical protein [Shimia aestuarii]|uniref:hypothetical protein n=1 Tax=Shimia aestuarii TaxID=254406 RepID=UPI001FB470EC|nr:hypothetical protein [Shimia aestuarii]
MRASRQIILFVIAMAALVAMAFFDRNPLVRQAETYAEDIATSSAVLYVSLRGVNAFLSAAQEIEVGGSLVVQGTAQPFKVLEPIDDTVERISDIVFYVMVVTGILSVALGPASAVGAALVGVALIVWLLEKRMGAGRRVTEITRSLGWYGAILGVAVPLAFVLASLFADAMTRDVWAENEALLEEITGSIAPVVVEEDARGWSVWEDAKEYSRLASALVDRADALIASYVTILSVFVFRILILPMMLLGGFVLVVRMWAKPRAA